MKPATGRLSLAGAAGGRRRTGEHRRIRQALPGVLPAQQQRRRRQAQLAVPAGGDVGPGRLLPVIPGRALQGRRVHQNEERLVRKIVQQAARGLVDQGKEAFGPRQNRPLAQLLGQRAHRRYRQPLAGGPGPQAGDDLGPVGRVDDRLNGLIHLVCRQYDFDFHLGQKIHHIFGPAVKFGMALLTTKTLDLNHTQPLNAHILQRFFHFIELEGFDDGFDLFHIGLLFAILAQAFCPTGYRAVRIFVDLRQNTSLSGSQSDMVRVRKRAV